MNKLTVWDLDFRKNYCEEIYTIFPTDTIFPSERNMMKLYKKQCEIIDKISEIEERLNRLAMK